MTSNQLEAGIRVGSRWLSWARRFGWTFWLATALLFVFSLPHVMALRNLLILMLLGVVWARLKDLRSMLKQPAARVAAIALIALLAWMIFVIFFLSPAPAESLRTFVGDWGRVLIVLVAGAGVGMALGNRAQEPLSSSIAMLIFLASLAHVVGHDLAALLRWANLGDLPARFPGITDHRANVTHMFAFLLSVVGADLCSRYLFGRPVLNASAAVIGGSIVLGFFALLTSSTTNGWFIAMLLTLLIIGSSLVSRRADDRMPLKKRNVVIALSLCFVVLGGAAVINDPRYEGFLETVEIGWDTEGHRQWLDAEHTDQWPVRGNGETVDPSTYSRVAWAKEGMLLMLEHPLGTEISKHTFEELIKEKYGVAYMAHSHVGLIDFGLNVGFPGLVLWLVFLGALAWIGVVTFRRSGDAIGLALLLVVAAFSARMLIDSTMRDHILEQFMFCVGMLAVACENARQKACAEP